MKYYLVTLKRTNEDIPETIPIICTKDLLSSFILVERSLGRDCIILWSLEISKEDYEVAAPYYKKKPKKVEHKSCSSCNKINSASCKWCCKICLSNWVPKKDEEYLETSPSSGKSCKSCLKGINSNDCISCCHKCLSNWEPQKKEDSI